MGTLHFWLSADVRASGHLEQLRCVQMSVERVDQGHFVVDCLALSVVGKGLTLCHRKVFVVNKAHVLPHTVHLQLHMPPIVSRSLPFVFVPTFKVVLVRWNEPFQKLATCDTDGGIFVWIQYEGRWSVELVNDRGAQVRFSART